MRDPVPSDVQAPEPEAPASGLHLRLFGPAEVRVGPNSLPPLRSRKGLWLLALLALRAGRGVERGWLAATLWPEADDVHARRSLRQSLHDLRLALGGESWRIASEGPGRLRLDLAGAFVDALAFDAALARGDLDSLAAAVRLYRGPLLEDCPEEWSLEQRRRREEAYLTALQSLAGAAVAGGEPAAAASYLRLAVGADPYREDFQRFLMEALVAAGSPADALLVYRQFRDLLWREMSAEPARETTALFQRLRDETRARTRPTSEAAEPASDAVPPAPRSNLPRPLSAFIGRESELREVRAALSGARLVTLTGTGGVGKTRLAIRIAEECEAEFEDGVWFVDLAALADAGLVPQTVARALSVREGPDSSLPEALTEALRGRRLLLVLDNCEHLIDACARLANALLSSCTHLCILATSRQPLGLTGEVAWPVPPLSLPPEEAARRPGPPAPETSEPYAWAPDALLGYEAIRLLVERAATAFSGFTLDVVSAPATVHVCRRLDGIPLAIELAAARLRALSLDQIAAHLDDRFRLLTGGSRAALPRQQTLLATMDWSYDLLSETERVLLRRLSVFAGGFTLEAAEAVCSLPPSAFRLLPSDVLDLLTQLVDRSLVGVEKRGRAARYLLLETTREYARRRLGEAGEADAIRDQHARFFLDLAERAAPELRGAAQAEWLQRLDEAHDNLRAAAEHFLGEGAVEEGLRLGASLGWFWWLRGYLSEGRERLQALLARSGYEIRPRAAGGRTDPPGDGSHPEPRIRLAQARALNAAGMLADDQADYAAAQGLFEASLAHCRELGDPAGAASALCNLGGLALHARDFPAARALYEESLALWREIGDPWWTAAVLTNLGRTALYSGDLDAAPPFIEGALEIQRQLQDRRAIARSLTTLGDTVARQGDSETALALLVESLSIVRDLGAKHAIEETLCSLGRLACDRGDHEATLAYHGERLALAREMGSAWGVADSLYDLGLVARDRGEGTRAAALWSECLTIARRLQDHQRIADCLEGLAGLAAQPEPSAPEPDDARGRARRAARLFGAAAAVRGQSDSHRADQVIYERDVAAARAILDGPAFDAAWREGRAMSLEQAVAAALREAGRGGQEP